jgi:hypothetical protein
MSDLAHLFPNLARALDDWDGRKATTDGSDDPSHGGVTDADVEAYLSQMGSLRAPLSPTISGQQPPPTPEFANNGRAMPPGSQQSYMEPPDPAAVDTASESGEEESLGEVSAPPPDLPTAPAAPAPTVPTPDFYEIAGRKYDRRQAEAWAQFDDLVNTDPGLRDAIQSYLSQRSSAPPPPAPLPQPEAIAGLVDLPRLPEEYEGDETIATLYKAVRQQQAALDRISRQAAQAEQIASSQAQRTYTDIAKGAMTEFQRSHSLDDSTMQAVSRAAAATGFAEKYMAGLDPLTGTPVAPDPYRAVISALNAGYMMAPETRDMEIARLAEARATRRLVDDERKQKLAGVSGASGSVPRTQPVPANPSDARNALVAEVSQMMNGEWMGDGT